MDPDDPAPPERFAEAGWLHRSLVIIAATVVLPEPPFPLIAIVVDILLSVSE
jgi:hypothetical protein